MLGDRRTFMGETSIRVLENRLGIQRDRTLTYQNSYRNNNFNSGYYNNGAVRGGHDNNANSGVPYNRNAERPAYNLGRQSHEQHKRVKTGNDQYDMEKQPYDPYDPFRLYSRPPPQPRGPPVRGYPPNPYGHQMYPQNPPMRNPNEVVNLRPPPTTSYSNFDGGRPPVRHSIQDKREKKNDDANRFSGFDNK